MRSFRNLGPGSMLPLNGYWRSGPLFFFSVKNRISWREQASYGRGVVASGGQDEASRAWMHMLASALTGLRTLGKLLYYLASVTSSCKRGVRAHTPGPARKASWPSYEAQLSPGEVSCSRLHSALSWIYWEMAASGSPFLERLTQNGICQALLASQLSSFCRYSQIFSRHCPISLSGIAWHPLGSYWVGIPRLPWGLDH